MTATATPLPDVPVPSPVADGKYYLPSCDLVATVPSQAQAEALEKGLLSLLQYRGNPVAGFDAAAGCPGGDADPFATGHHCPVALATRLQLYASVALGDTAVDPTSLVAVGRANAGGLEAWETDYVTAAAAFLAHDFEGCVAACRGNLQRTPRDVFSARLLLIAAYFGEDMESLCDAFGAITADFEAGVAAQRAAVAAGAPVRHALQLALPSLMAWAAFGLEETRRDVARAETLARRATALTHELNARYFPTGRPATDAPNRVAALASVSDDSPGFLCVFGVHVVCHCFETRGDPAGGLAYLKAEDPALWQPSAHLAGHVWWHYALFQLECGDVTASLSTYAERLGDPLVGDPFALSDSSALVVRVWQWASWFRAAATGPAAVAAAAPWASLSPQDESAACHALRALNAKWGTHGDAKFADFPFFVAHKQLVRAADAVILPREPEDAKDGDTPHRFRQWPRGGAGGLNLSWRPVPAEGVVTHGPARRHSLALQLRTGATELAEAAQLLGGPEPAKAAGAFVLALEGWLAIASTLSAPKPASPATRVVRACMPMGGSVAQQGLLSTALLMLWLVSTDRADALLALHALAFQHPEVPLVRAMLAAATAAADAATAPVARL